MSVSPMSSTRSPSLIWNGSAARERSGSERKSEAKRGAAGRRLDENMAAERGWTKNNRAPSLSSAGGACAWRFAAVRIRLGANLADNLEINSSERTATHETRNPDNRGDS